MVELSNFWWLLGSETYVTLETSPRELKLLAALEMNKIMSVCQCLSIWSVWIIHWVPMMMTCGQSSLPFVYAFRITWSGFGKKTKQKTKRKRVSIFVPFGSFLGLCRVVVFAAACQSCPLCSFTSGLRGFHQGGKGLLTESSHTKVHTPKQYLLDCSVGSRAETNYLHTWESVQVSTCALEGPFVLL